MEEGRVQLLIPSKSVYNQHNGIELETKIILPPNVYSSLLKYYLKTTPKLEQSINIIKKADSGSYVNNLLFSNKDLSKKVSTYNKHLLTKPYRGNMEYGDFNMTLYAEDSYTGSVSIKNAELARVKYRLSWKVPSARSGLFINVDFTMTSTIYDLGKNASKLLDYKKKYFHTWDGKVKNLSIPSMQSMELELEYVGKIFKLAPSDVCLDIQKYVCNPISKEHFDVVGGGISPKYHDVLIECLNKFKKYTISEEFKYKHTLNRSLPKVKVITHYTYNIIYENIHNYYITEKLDGVRALVYINDKTMYIISSDLIEVKLPKALDLCIFDAEMYKGDLYLFDTIACGGEVVTDLPFVDRLSVGMKCLTKLNVKYNGKIEFKDFRKLPENGKARKELIASIYNNSISEDFGMDVDGLIFTDGNGSPYETTSTYKWKPQKYNTVDFYMKIAPDKILGKYPLERHSKTVTYIMFCSLNEEMRNNLGLRIPSWYQYIITKNQAYGRVFPYPFITSRNVHSYVYHHPVDSPVLDNFVCEMGYNVDKDEWEFHKIRDDRQIDVNTGVYYGNYYTVAENNYSNYFYPFDIEHFGGPPAGYFGERSDITLLNRHYNTIIKYKIFNDLNGMISERGYKSDYIIDLAAGHGQDMQKYNTFKPREVMFIDKDAAALNELTTRKNLTGKQAKKLGYRIYTLEADLMEKYNITMGDIRSMIAWKANIIMINFAFHYFCKSTSSIKNTLMLIHKLINENGYITITGFDGEAVHNIIRGASKGEKSKKPQWDVYEGDALKYSIIKQYSSGELAIAGQKISVLLPFSNGDYYDEYLINSSYLRDLFNSMGYTEIVNKSFTDKSLMEYYKSKNIDNYRKLSREDKVYLGLYNVWIYKKNSTSK